MEIGFKHWFSTFSVALLIHMFAVMNVNLTGASAESVHPFTQYVVDLTTLAPPPPKPPAPPPLKPAKPKPKPIPKPVPEKPKPPKPQKVVVPELEKPVQKIESKPEEPPPLPQPEQTPVTQEALPEQTTAASPKPGARAKKTDYSYYQLILDRLDRLKRYPARARRRGIEGTVILAFTLNRDGSLKHYEIRQTSGHKALDIEVKKLIQRAAPFPAVPANIGREQVELSVPISFALR